MPAFDTLIGSVDFNRKVNRTTAIDIPDCSLIPSLVNQLLMTSLVGGDKVRPGRYSKFGIHRKGDVELRKCGFARQKHNILPQDVDNPEEAKF